MMDEQNCDLITAYFNYVLRIGEKVDFRWAYEEVDETVRCDPAQAFELVLALLEAAPSKQSLSYVAAGPLEELIIYHWAEIRDAFYRTVPTNKPLQFALVGVWLDEEDNMAEEIEEIKQKYDLDETDPISGIPWSADNPQPG